MNEQDKELVEHVLKIIKRDSAANETEMVYDANIQNLPLHERVKYAKKDVVDKRRQELLDEALLSSISSLMIHQPSLYHPPHIPQVTVINKESYEDKPGQ